MARDIDRRLVAAGRGARRGLTAAIALGFAAGLAVIGQAFVLARIVSALVFRHVTLGAVRDDLIALGVVFLVRAGLSFGAEVAAHRAAAAVKLSLRRLLLDHVFALGPHYAAGERSADLAATALEGIEALEPYLARYLPQMALVALVPLAVLAAVLRFDWISALVLVVSGPIIPLFMVFIGYRAEAINQRQWRQLLVMSAHFLDAVQGITTLKLFGRAREEIALIGRISDDYRRVTMAGLRVAFLTSAALEFFASLSIALVAVLFGARLIHGDIAFFPAFFVLLLVPAFFQPLRGLATHYHARMNALAAARRLFDVLDTAPMVRWGEAPVPAGAVSIGVAGLVVAYGPGPAVLRGIDCVFPAGSLTAIVGRSGAGKSSLAAALLGFVAPASGGVVVNGEPLDTLDRAAWWRCLAYVPQAPRLFAGSIADNLRLARPDATVPAMLAALARAGLRDVVMALPGGLDARIGDGGAGLSGGQVQRLALARAFLKDAPVLILDEATAHLDLETEAELTSAIGDLVRGRTAIVIAHRLATVRHADRILVLDAGRIVESGTHAALLARGGVYAGLIGAGSVDAAVSCAI
ncbi:thiol reductant ABC exporter subunit CydD [Acidiphilium sp. PA]|uniref:thiol reductant ABC exporter subunit CydD n=1 Tax=Acidiphilium sp. PA TaxID=2871705 RepID=UPI002244ECF2|nr:thiol reductant ABC exporter subunit CydD [Acidiphilium sp. PA]MCW8308009.1 thiol reductant ABC exporter subunit CydD [Acidiphilium sp. PA]